jgi:dynein light intermediate chain 2
VFAAAAKQREKQASEQNIRDIWTILTEDRAREQAQQAADKIAALSGDPSVTDKTREALVLFVGPRQAGKTTLANSYMFKERDEVPRPTTCLEYKYARSALKESLADEKAVTHFWELGGGRALTQLLSVPLTPATLPHALVVLCVDLGRTSRVLDDAQFFLSLVRRRAEEVMGEMRQTQGAAGEAMAKQLLSNARKRFGETHADLARVELMPVPVLIVANKLDLLGRVEPEGLRVLSRSLRALAHANGASLLYNSRAHKDSLGKTFRARIMAHVMNNAYARAPPPPGFDHTLSLIQVVAGQDSFAQIGEAPGGGAAAGKSPFASWQAAFAKMFPDGGAADAEPESALETLALEPEKSIDAALSLRAEDLKTLQRELDLRRKLNAKDNSNGGGDTHAGRLR